ncbi:MAG: hypothetical protein QM831_42805 [Kofleriaceae bacterium]
MFAIVLGLAIGSTACGDDSPYVPGSGTDGGSDMPPGGSTLTSYVIDLVQNHTTDQAAHPYSEFKDLSDPDGDMNNVHAYDVLFQ